MRPNITTKAVTKPSASPATGPASAASAGGAPGFEQPSNADRRQTEHGADGDVDAANAEKQRHAEADQEKLGAVAGDGEQIVGGREIGREN